MSFAGTLFPFAGRDGNREADLEGRRSPQERIWVTSPRRTGSPAPFPIGGRTGPTTVLEDPSPPPCSRGGGLLITRGALVPATAKGASAAPVDTRVRVGIDTYLFEPAADYGSPREACWFRGAASVSSGCGDV